MEWFAQEFLYRCSYWRASAYVGGPNPLTWEDIYQHQFRVASYKEIPDERFDEAMAFLREELRKATGGSAPEQGSLF